MIYLDRDPKASQSELAKKLKISQQVVNYKINNFLKEGKISKFGTVVDFLRLGFEQYRIFLKFKKFKSDQQDLFNYFSNHPNIYWAARIGSVYDFLVVLIVKNYLGFERFIEELNQKFPDIFGDYDAVLVHEHEFLDHSFYIPSCGRDLGRKRIKYKIVDDVVSLDKIDIKILDEIKDSCRKSNLSIGNKLSISYKTVQNRIKNMEENGVISGYRIFIKSKRFNPYIVLISYSKYAKDIEKKMFAEISQIPEFTQIVKLFGSWNLFLHARCKDNEELQNLIIDLREKYNIIQDYLIIPIFKDIVINLFPH